MVSLGPQAAPQAQAALQQRQTFKHWRSLWSHRQRPRRRQLTATVTDLQALVQRAAQASPRETTLHQTLPFLNHPNFSGGEISPTTHIVVGERPTTSEHVVDRFKELDLQEGSGPLRVWKVCPGQGVSLSTMKATGCGKNNNTPENNNFEPQNGSGWFREFSFSFRGDVQLPVVRFSGEWSFRIWGAL